MKPSASATPDSVPVRQRAKTLSELANGTLDLLVIGGGIVGAGVARDAALRGLRVGLAEQHDFAYGTSSRSSRLLHGGLRYLAQGRLGLVREASVEKRVLHQIAPHLADPLAFIFPTYQGTDWPLWQLRIGVKVYDLLCSGKNLGKSGSLTREQVLQKIPKLDPNGLTGGVRYFDAFTNDARLVLDTLRSAANAGALLANYLQFKASTLAAGCWSCELEDILTGAGCSVRAKAVINATGPWAERVPHSQVKLRLTKGVHLIIERERLPIPEAVAITQAKRLLFLIPWGERLILGTTDTDYFGSPEDVRPAHEDFDYVLRTVNEFFPAAALAPSDIISSWAGLRPLIAESASKDGFAPSSEQKGLGEKTPTQISRTHQIRNPEPGWWDLAGGKLTTYRLMAEQTLDKVVNWLKKTNGAKHGPPCRTAGEPLLPPAQTNGLSGILPPPLSRAAVEHFCRNEWAIHLDDIMVRRSGWHYYLPDARLQAEQVADWMAQIAGWSAADRIRELQDYERSTSPTPPPASAASPQT